MRARGQRREKKGNWDEEEKRREDPSRAEETIKFQSLLSNSERILYILRKWGGAARVKPFPMLPRSTKNGQRNSGADCYAREIRSPSEQPAVLSLSRSAVSDTNQFNGDLKNLSKIPALLGDHTHR